MAKDYHIFRDPVHGFIRVNDLERAIIDSKPFQRLRNIRQLAFTNLVYHSAEHSRFGHSIGVMEFATNIYDTIIAKHKSDLSWKKDDIRRNRQLLRLVTLMHDVGHAPFSHASEELFPDNMKHEDMTCEIIKSRHISSILDSASNEFSLDSQDIVEIFSSELIESGSLLLKQLLTGDIDADKMDYLLRDSLFTGVHYGKYDHERLVNTLCLIRDPGNGGSFILGIEEGGVHALEALILARYFMFTQVYFHAVRRAYDCHLNSFLKDRVKKYPSDVDSFLEWDDVRVIHLLMNTDRDENATRIINRRHFTPVFETPEHPTDEEITRLEFLYDKFVKEFEAEEYFTDMAAKAPHKFSSAGFHVKKRTNDYQNLVKHSKLIKNLEKIEQHRIYTKGDIKRRATEFCRDFWNRIDITLECRKS